MKTCRKERVSDPLILIRPAREKEKKFAKRNQQLMRKREIDALVEISRQLIIDKYIDLEN